MQAVSNSPEPGGGGPETPPETRPGLAARLRQRAAAAIRRRIAAGADLTLHGWRRRPPAARAAAILFAAALAGLGAHGILFQASLDASLPAPIDWAALRALVERDARPGDAAALSPPWAERAREILPAALPLLGPVGPDEDLVGVRRVWLISLPGAPGFGWERELQLLARAVRSDPAERLGAIEVTRHELAAPELPLSFLPDRLAQANLSMGGVPCRADTRGFICAGPPAVRVERTVRQVGGGARPCLTVDAAGPLPSPVVLAFGGVPIGRTVRVRAGVVDDPGIVPGPARLSVQLDGEDVGAAEIPGPGFAPFDFETSRFAARFRTVTLVITTTAGAPLCLDAVTLP